MPPLPEGLAWILDAHVCVSMYTTCVRCLNTEDSILQSVVVKPTHTIEGLLVVGCWMVVRSNARANFQSRFSAGRLTHGHGNLLSGGRI